MARKTKSIRNKENSKEEIVDNTKSSKEENLGETEDGLSPTQKKGEEISQEEGIINQIRKSDPRIRNKIKELLEKEELN